jgi:hypothetical protein
LSDTTSARLIDASIEPMLETTAGDGDMSAEMAPRPPAIMNPQSLLEDGLHARGKPAFVLVAISARARHV